MDDIGSVQGVYVQPKTDCPHVLSVSGLKSHHASSPQQQQALLPPLVEGFTRETYQRPCGTCGDERENWLCLGCGDVFCSRYHNIALSFSDASVWCFDCEEYIVSPLLLPLLKRFSHVKFGAEEDDEES